MPKIDRNDPVLNALFKDLRNQLNAHDSDAAVRTIRRIEAVAGREFAICLVDELIAGGLRRMTAEH